MKTVILSLMDNRNVRLNETAAYSLTVKNDHTFHFSNSFAAMRLNKKANPGRAANPNENLKATPESAAPVGNAAALDSCLPVWKACQGATQRLCAPNFSK